MAQSPVSSTQVQPGLGQDWGISSVGTGASWADISDWPRMARAAPLSSGATNPRARAEIAQVLAAWRAAERRLQDLLEASPMRIMVSSEIAKLRAEYQRLFARAMR
jgi:hypothetical protein